MGGNSLQRCAFSSNGGVCHASPAHRTGNYGGEGARPGSLRSFQPGTLRHPGRVSTPAPSN